MRILLLVKNFDYGGAENHVRDLANELIQTEQHVWIVSKKGRQIANLRSGITHHSIPLSDIRLLSNLVFIFRLTRREKIDIIHAHQHLPILLATLVRILCKIPVVATIHGRIQHDVPHKIERKVINKFIAVSENGLNGLLNDNWMKDKAQLIPNGIHLPVPFKLLEKDHLSIYYISRIDQRHATMISMIITEVWPEFIIRHPNSVFNVVGDSKFLNQIENLVEESKQKYNFKINLLGYSSEIICRVKEAGLILGVGRIAIKSLACGVPVFSIKHNRIGEIITTKNFEEYSYSNFVKINGSIPQPAEILSILEDFSNNQKFYLDETKQLKEKLKEKYAMQKVISSTIDLYQEILEYQ